MARHILLVLLTALLLGGCATMRIPGNLSEGILGQDDLTLVDEGLPAYLLTLDGLVLTYPDNVRVLSAAAELYSAYAGVFVTEPERQRRLSRKALDYAQRAACADIRALCDLNTLRAIEAETRIASVTRERNAPSLFLLGSVWASYIQAHSDDWNAVAQLTTAQRLLEQQVQLQPGYNNGMGELYLGIIASLVPPALGGQPEVARAYFESAIEYSQDRNLIIKVYYAEQYARLMFDQALHDELLNAVLAADPAAGNLTLQNTYAQQLARELLATSDQYF